MSFPTSNRPQKGAGDDDTARRDLDEGLAEDLNHHLHVDSATGTPYVVGLNQQTRRFTVPTEGDEAVEAMRKHLDSLLPVKLIQDAYGEPTLITEVSRQHLAKLQAKLWCDLPKMVTTISSPIEAKVTDQDIVTAKAVSWLSTQMSMYNGVFILQPDPKKGCHFALCGTLHTEMDPSTAQTKVTVEPLVDWMTLDPVTDVETIWVSLFRRNKKLLHKFSISNSKFIRANPLRLCLGCLNHLADSRIEIWRMLEGNPSILATEGHFPWRGPGLDGDKKMRDGEEADVSATYTSGPKMHKNGFNPMDW